LADLDVVAHLDQLMLRAAIYRLVTAGVAYADQPDRLREEARGMVPTVERTLERCEARRASLTAARPPG
jgi:hypothetical protein